MVLITVRQEVKSIVYNCINPANMCLGLNWSLVVINS